MTYSLGIDLHKRSSVWVLLDEEKRVLSRQSIPATRGAVPAAVAALGVAPTEVQVAIEPVCGWRWYAAALEHEGLTVKIANPSQIRLIADSKNKTDENDAHTLADLLRADFLPESYRAPDDIAALRSLVRERAYLVSLQTGTKNRLHGIVLRAGYLEEAGNALRKRNEAALRALHDGEIDRMRDLLADIAVRIRTLEKTISATVKGDAVATLLMTMPGVGIITAAAVRAEVGDFARFKSSASVAAYAGLVPSQRSSGSMVRMGRITKRGSSLLRYSLVEAAFRVRATHPLYPFFDRLAPKLGKKRARVALARKILTVLWVMVTKREPFDKDRTHRMTKRDDLASAFLAR